MGASKQDRMFLDQMRQSNILVLDDPFETVNESILVIVCSEQRIHIPISTHLISVPGGALRANIADIRSDFDVLMEEQYAMNAPDNVVLLGHYPCRYHHDAKSVVDAVDNLILAHGSLKLLNTQDRLANRFHAFLCLGSAGKPIFNRINIDGEDEWCAWQKFYHHYEMEFLGRQNSRADYGWARR